MAKNSLVGGWSRDTQNTIFIINLNCKDKFKENYK